MNSKYAEGMSYKYATLLFYIDSIWIGVSYRMIPVKGCTYTKSTLYIICVGLDLHLIIPTRLFKIIIRCLLKNAKQLYGCTPTLNENTVINCAIL